jgi:hypothetical protein
MWRQRVVTVAFILSVAGAVCCLLSVLVYEKPESFYVNFVILPSLVLTLAAWSLDLIAIVLALLGLKGPARKKALLSLGLAIGCPVLAMGIIQLMQL